MKRYVGIFEHSAQADVRESFDWGCRAWGKREAQQWARQLRTAVFEQLGVVPKAFQLARENDEFSEEIRQMIRPLSRVVYDQGSQGPQCFTLEERILWHQHRHRRPQEHQKQILLAFSITAMHQTHHREPRGRLIEYHPTSIDHS